MVGQDACSWVQTGIVASSQPGEIKVDGADNVAGEDRAGARGHGGVTVHADSWRRLCRVIMLCQYVVGSSHKLGMIKKARQACSSHIRRNIQLYSILRREITNVSYKPCV